MGPQAARSFPGQRLITPAAPEAERAKQEIDYGRRGSGNVFGAFQPASGAALTHPYDRRTTTNWVDFLGEVEAWIDPAVERIYAVTDNLSTHSAPDVLLFSLLHPRWEFVFQPKYAAYLNLVRPELPMFQYTWALAAESMKRKGVLHREKTQFTWVPLPGSAKERSDVPSAGNNGLRAGSLNLARP